MNDTRAARSALAIIVTASLLGPSALALSGGSGAPGRPVLVLVAPWRDAEAAARAAGGRIIALADAPLATLAVFETADFAARLRSTGALAFSGDRIASLCGVP